MGIYGSDWHLQKTPSTNLSFMESLRGKKKSEWGMSGEDIFLHAVTLKRCKQLPWYIPMETIQSWKKCSMDHQMPSQTENLWFLSSPPVSWIHQDYSHCIIWFWQNSYNLSRTQTPTSSQTSLSISQKFLAVQFLIYKQFNPSTGLTHLTLTKAKLKELIYTWKQSLGQC